MRKLHLIFKATLYLGFLLTPSLLASGERNQVDGEDLQDISRPFGLPGTGDLDGEPALGPRARWPVTERLMAPLADTPDMELVWTVSSSFYGSVWGDVNGDGRLDLVMGRSGNNELYLNVNGQLESNPSWSSNLSTTTYAVALGDLDLDGDLDLVCANSGTGQTNTLYRNDGGTFTLDPVWRSSAIARSRDVVLADFDGDGDLDLAFANSGSVGGPPASNRIYRNDGGVITDALVWESTANEDTRGIAAGDLDEDGFLDLVCANYGGALADTFQFFGTDVSSAGDFNADGYDDLITAAAWWIDGVPRGRPFVFFGGPGADSLADLVLSDVSEEPSGLGTRTEGVGDVNGDGYDDLVAGGSSQDQRGRVLVYFGGPSPDGTPDWILTGAVGEGFGISLAAAGDVNNDGFADLIIGASLNDEVAGNAGKAYLYLGGASPDTLPDLEMFGEAESDQFGFGVSGVGDVNNDGFADFAIGAPFNDGTGNNIGRVSVYLGGSVPDAQPDLVLSGEVDHDNFGSSVSSAGDVNNDGFTDIVIGAPFNDESGSSAGKAYVYFGGASLDSSPDLEMTGEAVSDRFGTGLSGAGDVNNDGFADIVIGAPYNDEAGSSAGKAYIYLGASVPDTLADLEMTGNAAGDNFGLYLTGSGDITGDGFSDIAIASIGNDLAGLSAGSVSIFFGGSPMNILTDLSLRGPDGAIQAGGENSIYLSQQGVLPTTPTWKGGRKGFTHEVALGDVDGDGDLDPVFDGYFGPSRADQAEYTWYSNDVDSVRTTPAWVAPVPGLSWDLELGDLDQDGDLDLVAAGFDGVVAFSNIFINVNGGYAQQADGALPDLDIGSVRDVALGDIDDDGDLDISVCGIGNSAAPGAASLIRNNQQQWFSADTTWSTAGRTQTTGLDLGDLDGDGDLDIVFANLGFQHAHMNEAGSVNRSPGWISNRLRNASDVALRDLDGNGFPEAVFSTFSQEPFFVHDNSGELSLNAWESQDKPSTQAIDLGDVNLDGKIDLVSGNSAFIINPNCASPSVPDAVHHGSSGAFWPRPNWESNPPQGHTRGMAIADLDGDLDLDLVCANTCNQANTLYLNKAGSLGGRPDWMSQEIGGSWDVKVGDTDGDGRADLVYGRDSDLAVYRGVGDSTLFSLSQAFGIYGARTIALGDVNADGRLDVVAGLWGPNGLYLNRGLSFDSSPAWESSLRWMTSEIALGDLDQDGDLDLVCGNNDVNNLAQRNTIYDGLRNPAFRGDPENPVNHQAQNSGMIRSMAFEQTSVTTYRARFEVVDIESDPVWVYPEYRIPPARNWSPIVFTGETERVGLLASSPQGVQHEFDWDAAAVPLTRSSIDVRVRWTPVPVSSVGMIRNSGVYQYTLTALPTRAQIAVPQMIAFPTVTLGDTATVDLVIQNVGTDILTVTDIQFGQTSLWTEHPTSFAVGVNSPGVVPLLMEPGDVGDTFDPVIVTTNDPLSPEISIAVQTDIRALSASVQALAPTPAPLGEALTILVSPETHVESGVLIFTLDRASGDLPAGENVVPLIPVGGEFIGIIPVDAVTELGVDYYVRLENSGFTQRVPLGAPNFPFHHPVEAPDEMAVQAQTNLGSGYLEGFNINVQALLEPGAVFETGTLFHRRGGETDFQSQDLSLTGILPAAVIPDSMVDSRGVEYWVRVSTAGGALLRSPETSPVASPYALQITVLNKEEPEWHAGGKYRMVSFPIDFGPQFTGTIEALLSDQEQFGSYDPLKWRAFWYSPQAGIHVELPAEDTAGEFTPRPGRAYWLISKDSHRVDTKPISGSSTRTDIPVSITLAPGWNQIGNPYAFPVDWNQALVDGVPTTQSTAVEPPVFYNGDGYELDQSILVPFEGYWVRNTGTDPVVLVVPPLEMTGSAAARRRSVPLSRETSGWEARITAVSVGIGDAINVVGVDPAASLDQDHLDRSDPPMMPGEALSVHFPQDEWEKGAGSYTVDFRPPATRGNGGHAWVFDVAKNFRRQESGDPATLEFDIGEIPEEFQVFLLDSRFDRFVDLRMHGNYECTLGEKSVAGVDQARFEFLVGSEEFIQSRREGLSGVSFTNRLFQNYPNPFRSDTMIRYEVAESGPIQIQVFDTQGRLVRSLIDGDQDPGRYEARWNGRNEHGQGVAPGIYFFRITSPHLQQTRRMVLIQ